MEDEVDINRELPSLSSDLMAPAGAVVIRVASWPGIMRNRESCEKDKP
jgi:hypothetical protein